MCIYKNAFAMPKVGDEMRVDPDINLFGMALDAKWKTGTQKCSLWI